MKRREKRKMNYERIITAIQYATTPQELLLILIEIEEAIPKMLKFNADVNSLPSTADTTAALAVRVHNLDRRIRYDEIKDVEKQGLDRSYRPRYQFAPRCMMDSSCTKSLTHVGKCSHDAPINVGTSSRIPELDSAIGVPTHNSSISLQQRLSQGGSYAMTSSMNYPISATSSSGGAGGSGVVASGFAVKKKESGWDAWKARKAEMMGDRDVDIQRLAAKRKEAQDTDIEYQAPMLPIMSEITVIGWV